MKKAYNVLLWIPTFLPLPLLFLLPGMPCFPLLCAFKSHPTLQVLAVLKAVIPAVRGPWRRGLSTSPPINSASLGSGVPWKNFFGAWGAYLFIFFKITALWQPSLSRMVWEGIMCCLVVVSFLPPLEKCSIRSRMIWYCFWPSYLCWAYSIGARIMWEWLYLARSQNLAYPVATVLHYILELTMAPQCSTGFSLNRRENVTCRSLALQVNFTLAQCMLNSYRLRKSLWSKNNDASQ